MFLCQRSRFEIFSVTDSRLNTETCEYFVASVKLRVITMRSWVLQALRLLYVDFTAFQTCVRVLQTCLQKQTDNGRHFIEKEQEIAGEREEVGRKG